MARLKRLLAAALLVGSLPCGTVHGDPEALNPARRSEYTRPQQIPYPADNPWSQSKAALGAALFADPILSGERKTACITCHRPAQAWADNLSRGIGDRQERMALRSPTLLDVAWVPLLGWNGNAIDIETISLRAITTPGNMDLPLEDAVARLAANAAYVRQFEAAFGPGPITPLKIAEALATFQRGIISAETPFDRWIAGDEAALSPAAQRGFTLFAGKARCTACHSGWAFSDYSFQDIGLATGKDLGRGRLFPKTTALQYAFKTPTLRDVARRAPYGHDGSLPTLAAVVEHYNQGGIDRPSRPPEIRPLGLTPDEKADLVAFLESLTGSAPSPHCANPKEPAEDGCDTERRPAAPAP